MPDTRTLGRLKARIVTKPGGSEDGGSPVVVLLHGFGAPGDDLVPLTGYLDAPPGTRFVFPEAPLELDLGLAESRAWWMIDMVALQMEMLGGQRRDRSAEVPTELAARRAEMIELLDALKDQTPAPTSLVLGGFSQGAMLACDVALHWEGELAGLCLLSTALIARTEWEAQCAGRRGLRVLQSHGRQDPILSFEGGSALRSLLSDNGLIVDWQPFRGGHEIPLEVLQSLGDFLGEVL